MRPKSRHGLTDDIEKRSHNALRAQERPKALTVNTQLSDPRFLEIPAIAFSCLTVRHAHRQNGSPCEVLTRLFPLRLTARLDQQRVTGPKSHKTLHIGGLYSV